MTFLEHIFKRHSPIAFSILAILAFAVIVKVFAAPPPGGFASGTELDPNCIPGSTDCFVASGGGAFDTSSGVTSNSPGTFSTDDFVFGSSSLDSDGDSTHNSRFFFDKSKSAFRAGSAGSSSWNSANIGNYSAAFGNGAEASGPYSAAFGLSSATNDSAFAINDSNEAAGYASFAGGNFAQASGDRSFAFGHSTLAEQDDSIAMGDSADANGLSSIAIGTGASTSGDDSVALGNNNNATGNSSSAFGAYNQTISNFSNALGRNMIIGSDANDAEGSVGIGLDGNTYTITTPNILSIMGGNVGIGTSTPNNLLQVAGLVNFDNTQLNTFLGYQVGNSSVSLENDTAVGYQALFSGTTVGNSVAIGRQALYSDIDGDGNTAIGDLANYSNLHGSSNVSIGHQSLYTNDGDNNVAVGRYSLFSNASGGGNVAIGTEAGYNVTGSGNIFIGYRAGKTNATGNSELWIDNQDDTTPLLFGNFSTNRVGIATASPGSRLQINDPGTNPSLFSLFNETWNNQWRMYFVDNSGGVGFENGGIVYQNVFANGRVTFQGTTNTSYAVSISGKDALNTSNSLVVGSNTTTLFQFSNAGNLGIGTVGAPGAKLHITDGTIKIDGTGSPATGGALCLNASNQMSKCTSAVDSSGNCTCP